MNTSEPIPKFEPGASLARIKVSGDEWIIDCRGPYCARTYSFRSEGDAAEFAVHLERHGGWSLRFMPSASDMRALVEEITPWL